MIAVKRIIRHLKGIIGMGLWYPKTRQFFMTSFLMLTMPVVEWIGRAQVDLSISKKLACLMVFQEKNYVALSTAEAEYVAAAACCTQVL